MIVVSYLFALANISFIVVYNSLTVRPSVIKWSPPIPVATPKIPLMRWANLRRIVETGMYAICSCTTCSASRVIAKLVQRLYVQ